MAEEQLRIDALDYHERPTPGKISVTPTKALANQRDLSLAYSPGVAYACTAIQHDPQNAARYTSRANLVAVITNGTAVLGLGNIGALAGKPVMEGKGCLFKKFAGIDVFDIEIAETDPDRFVQIVAALEPTFGGINLEDIKAPECFVIERKLRERMKIPVFHDDQHGTAIVAAAAVLNGLAIVGKDIGGREARLLGRGCGSDRVPRPAGEPWAEPAQRLRDGQQRCRARRPQGQARPGQGALRATHRCAHARRRHRRRRRLPRPLGCRRTDAGHGAQDGQPADHPRDGESGAGDPAGAREGRAPGLPDRHRSIRLSEPGQQLALLPVHLPWCARLRRDDDQRTDEARGHPSARPARAGGALGAGCDGVWRGDARVRPRLPDPARVRPAADHEPRAGRRACGDGKRRRDAADRRPRRVSQPAGPVRLPVGDDDGPAVRSGEGGAQARDLRRGRGRARASRCASRARRGDGETDPRRPRGRHCQPRRQARVAAQARGERRGRQRPRRPSLSRRVVRVLPAREAQGRLARAGDGADAQPADADRRDAGAAWGRGCDALRNLRRLRGPPVARSQRRRHARRGLDTGGDAARDPARSAALHLRHACEHRSDGRAGRRDDAARGGGGPALRTTSQHRAAVAFELRQLVRTVGAEDARRAGADPRARTRPRRRRRDARRYGVVEDGPATGVSGFAAAGGREPAHHAERRCGEHHLQRAEDDRRRRYHCRRTAARRGAGRCTS